MPMVSHGSSSTADRDAAAKMPLALYLVAFLGMAALACWKGLPAGTPGPCSTGCPPESNDATAQVWIRQAGTAAGEPAGPPAGPAPDARDARPGTSCPDPLQVRRQILAWADESERDRLLVETAPEAAPGACKVSITLRDPKGAREGAPPVEHAAQDVNALAQRYADTFRAEWKSSVDRAYEEARTASERAAEQLQGAQGQLDAVLDRQIQAVREASQRLQPPPPAPAPPPPADNPDWTNLNRQLSELLGRRAELLAARTPLHPVVQDVEARIEATRRRLALVPRYVAGAAPVPATEVTGPPRVPPAAVADPAELEGLQRVVEGAGRAHNEAVRVERLAWQARLREPAVELELALEPPPPPRRWPPGAMALLGALATGLTMVVGLGMISAGAGIEPPLVTAAELQAAAGAPVIGTVPGDTGPHEPDGSAMRQRLLRWVLLLLGALGLAGSLVMLWLVHPA
ncbi:MAG: hypothetical protein ABSG86_13205 [Thermoguttaceae bacterium]